MDRTPSSRIRTRGRAGFILSQSLCSQMDPGQLSQAHPADTGNGLELQFAGASKVAHRPGAPPGPGESALPAPVGGENRLRRFNRAFTFDQFVVGASNRLAYQASQALARNDTFYNRSLFLTSGPGSRGKPQRSQAVGNFVTKSAAGKQVLYITAENFANEMVSALKNGRMSTFKERFGRTATFCSWRKWLLSGKEKIQAEVCYTLDTLMGQNKRLVFTSCYLPGEIGHLSQNCDPGSRAVSSLPSGRQTSPLGSISWTTKPSAGSRFPSRFWSISPNTSTRTCAAWKVPWIAWWPGRLAQRTFQSPLGPGGAPGPEKPWTPG